MAKKVYGIGENKCKVEVVPKGNIIEITYSSHLKAGERKSTTIYNNNIIGNVRLISLAQSVGGSEWNSPTFHESSSYVQKYTVFPHVAYNSSEGYCKVTLVNDSDSDATVYFKAVFLKL